MEIPEGVTTIDSTAFRGCANLTSITIPKSVTYLGEKSFIDCSKLKEIILNEGLTTISYNAFENCTELTTITIPNSVKNIHGNVNQYSPIPCIFEGCTNLVSINFAPGDNPIPNEEYAPWGAPNENVTVTKLGQEQTQEPTT